MDLEYSNVSTQCLAESEEVADPAPKEMEFRSVQSLAEQHLGKSGSTHNGAHRQLREYESDKIPAKEPEEQSNPWITPSFTPREHEESQPRPACPPEILPATTLSTPTASKPKTPRIPVETEGASRDGTLETSRRPLVVLTPTRLLQTKKTPIPVSPGTPSIDNEQMDMTRPVSQSTWHDKKSTWS